MSIIVFSGVSKSFGDVVALTDLTLSIEPGMTAVLGPNGAGKSTMLRLVVGLTRPDDGRIEVLGVTPRHDLSLYGRVGMVPQQEELFPGVDARTFVSLAGDLHGLADAGARADAALRTVDLDPAVQRPLRTYSKGMRQRVKLAQALVHDPELLILDEPLNGLDPVQRVRMIELFRHLSDEGRSVLVSSHVLEEVERFGSRILLLARGRLLAEGDFHDIREALDDLPRRVRVRTSAPRAVAAGLLEEGAADGVALVGRDTVLVDTSDIATFRRGVARIARDRSASLLEVAPLDESLESVFRDLLTGRPRT